MPIFIDDIGAIKARQNTHLEAYVFCYIARSHDSFFVQVNRSRDIVSSKNTRHTTGKEKRGNAF